MVKKTHIIESEDQLLRAFKNNDLDVLEELLHDNCLLILPNGLTVTKATVLNNYRTGNTAMTGITSTDQVINFVGDTAVVSVKIHLTGKHSGQVINAGYQYLRVWKFINGAWKVIAGSGMAI